MKITITNSRLSGASEDNIRIAKGADVDLTIDDKSEITNAGRHNIHVASESEPVKEIVATNQNANNGTNHLWFEKPIGKIGIGLVVALLSAAAIFVISQWAAP